VAGWDPPSVFHRDTIFHSPTLGRRKLQFKQTIQVTAAPTQVIAAFFAPEAIAAWWHTVRSVTTPRPLGVYAVEWEETPFQDDVLGSLWGVFYGTVMEFRNGLDFLVTDAHWLTPTSDAIGPMALEVSCEVTGPATSLRVRQSSSESSESGKRWARILRADRVWMGGLTGGPQAVSRTRR